MAELTPPPSKSSTPLRPSDQIESPVELLSPASTPGSGPSDLEPDIDPTDELGTIKDPEVISTDDESEEEEGMVLSDDELLQSSQVLDPTEGTDGGALTGSVLMAEGEGSKAAGGSKRKTRSTRKPKDKGKGKAVATPGRRGGGAGGGGGGKGRKEGELLESDIVSRWNHEFGDICRVQPPKA